MKPRRTKKQKPKVYEITTLADIFDKVPADRIADCCRELGQLLSTTKRVMERGIEAGKQIGIIDKDAKITAAVALEFPLHWVDDDKQAVTLSLHLADPCVAVPPAKASRSNKRKR